MTGIPEKDLKRVKIDKATSPGKGGLFKVVVDAWWTVTPEEEILFYRGRSPQCNQNENVVRSLTERLYKGCNVRQIPVVYIPINPQDYV